MGKKLRSIWQVLAVISALAVVLAVAPAIGQEGFDGEEVLRLHVDDDGRYFEHVSASGVTREPLPPLQGCRFKAFADDAIARLDAGKHQVGTHKVNIGVWSGGGQGVPCSRVDSKEMLTLSLGKGLFAYRAELDLEFKKDVDVEIQLMLHGEPVGDPFRVRSGHGGSETNSVTLTPEAPVGTCLGKADSGPDSGSSDNCRVILEPDGLFDAVQFKVNKGEMSLAGGGDFHDHDHALHDTILYLVQWDGTIECGQTVEPPEGQDQIAEITRLQYGECDPKLYRLRADREDETAGSVIFEFEDVDQPALYRAILTFQYDLENHVPLVGVLEYDPEPPYDDEDFRQMPACAGEFDENNPDPDIIPEGHDGCVVEATQQWDGTTVWTAVFYGDWKFR